MKYRLKYQTRGRVETYIAMTTATISVMAEELYDEHQLESILQSIAEEVQMQAYLTRKGLTADPSCEIEGTEVNPALIVRNTQGREVLTVYFERYENYRTIKRLH